MIKAPVVIKKDGKWLIGFMNENKFYPSKEIKKLSDVKNISDYKGLITFLRTNGMDRELADEILKKSGCDSIYILDKPIDLTEKQFELYWWMDIYPKCKQCIYDCKQSHKVKELSCKQFTRKK